jgi:hypothetical protein
MVKTSQLNVQVIATEEGADILINGRTYYFKAAPEVTLSDLRQLLSSETELTYIVVVQLLQELQ